MGGVVFRDQVGGRRCHLCTVFSYPLDHTYLHTIAQTTMGKEKCIKLDGITGPYMYMYTDRLLVAARTIQK
jgi:hypothetical protein